MKQKINNYDEWELILKYMEKTNILSFTYLGNKINKIAKNAHEGSLLSFSQKLNHKF